MDILTNVDSEKEQGTILFNKPEKKNAMSYRMQNNLKETISEVAQNDSVRVIVITGKGDVFSAGADIDEFNKRADNPKKELEFALASQKILETIETCPVPVIARVQGTAVGLGAAIVMASDLRVASHSAELIFGEINMGIAPPFERLRRNLSECIVREIMFTGRPLTSSEADKANVFNYVVTKDELDEKIHKLVDQIRSKSPNAIEVTKRSMRYGEDKSIKDSNAYRYSLNYQCFDHNDFDESIKAFKEGREPEY